MTLYARDRRVRVGDTVVTNTELSGMLRVNTSHRDNLPAGLQLSVTRILNGRVWARTIERYRESTGWYTELRARTYSIHLADLDYSDGAATPNDGRPGRANATRRLGQKPEDTEDLQYIGIDDPRVQWMWEDLGKYADGQHWCGEYDALAARMGIPARPRDFGVTHEHNGLRLTTTVRARSQREANELVAAALTPPAPETPTPTPSEPDAAIAA
jgi:hypothetical protein